VHDTWGIAEGFDVTIVDEGRALVVAEGVGYDNDGTPLVLASDARLEPEHPGEHDIVVLAGCALAMPRPTVRRCRSALVLGAVTAVHADTETLRWSGLSLRNRWARRRQSAYVRAGAQDFTGPLEELKVTTAQAHFPRTPLYFCSVHAIDKTDKVRTTLGIWKSAALNRKPAPTGPRHGPFFTVCAPNPDSFTVHFTRSLGSEHPAVEVSWVGVMPRTAVADDCQDYPGPIL
jgi:hypothetical protein